MTDVVRLFIQRDGANGIAAINPDTAEAVHIADEATQQNYDNAYNFITDLLALNNNHTTERLDKPMSDRYNAGFVIATAMSAENWALWVRAYPADGSHVWLTAGQEGHNGDYAFTASDLVSKREIVAANDHGVELPAFVEDVTGWSDEAYQNDRLQVVRMSAENWALWLGMWEVSNAA